MAQTCKVYGVAVPIVVTTMTNLTIVLTDNAVDFTFTVSLPNLTAGTYSAHSWVGHVAGKIRQYIKDRCDATAAITVKPVLANIDVSLGWPQPASVVPGVNTSKPVLHIGSMGGAASATGPCFIKSFAVNNNGNNWASLWGWAEVGENRLANAASGEVSANVLTSTCRFQPRFLYCYRANYENLGNEESVSGSFGDDHADGFATYLETGEVEYNKLITLTNNQRVMTGPFFRVGTFSSFGATRNLFNLLPLDSITAGEGLLNGMTGTYKRTDELTLGKYLRLGKTLYPVRFKSVAGNVFTCYETIPASYTIASGTPIYCLSEAHAMILEWRRTGLLICYDVDDSTGQTSWMGDSYVPAQQGKWVIGHERRTRIALYSVKVAGKLSLLPGYAVSA